MANPLNVAQFVKLLDGRLREVGDGVRDNMDLKSMIPVLFNVINSDSAWEEFYDVGDVPDIPEFNGIMTLLGISPGFHTKIEPVEFGGMLNIERKLIDDKKYPVLDQYGSGLMKAGMRTREKKGILPFANAFSSAFDYMTSEEGVALCSDSHTTKAGVSTSSGFDNAGTSALNKTSLAAAKLIFSGFRSDIGERLETDDLTLVVPENLSDKGEEILGTEKGLDTAAGNKNPLYKRHDMIVLKRLDDYDTDNWFLVDKSKMKRDLIWINRIKPEIETQYDFMTKMLMVSIYFRVAYGWKNWRWIYGSQVN